MLKLKKVELLGFKSFCDRGELRFTGNGIAAVVGPNGCGKSNIGDAVSWVLGEQSAKSLRSRRMDDVIFNGSRNRKPSGMAAVTLTLVDPDAAVEKPARGRLNGNGNGNGNGAARPRRGRPGEVTVTRKLFRSGESRYLLNGKTVRLRDVHDLFMGTGLGPNHYAIIEQGRIGQILSARPVDRRSFMEEAAGVTKFKARKRLAELKLENAGRNLHRVNDILQEIVRQSNSLKRQAAKAKRFEEYRELLDEALARLSGCRFRRMDAHRQRLDNEAKTAKEAFDARHAQTEALEQKLAEQRGGEQHWEAQVESAREDLAGLTVEVERLKARVEQQARTAEENAARKQQAENEAAEIVSRLESLRGEMREAERTAQDAESASAAVQENLQAKDGEIAAEQQSLQALLSEEEAGRARTLALLGSIAEARGRLAKLEEFLDGNERLAEQERQREAAAAEELLQSRERRAQLAEQAEAQQVRIEKAIDESNELRAAIESLERQRQRHEADANRLREDVSRLTARRESLNEILSHRAYTTESVKNIFDAVEQKRIEGFKPLGILADYIEVDAGCERAVEGFLRNELEYVVVSGWGEARTGVRLAGGELGGRATFLVHPQQPAAEEAFEPGPEEGVSGRLTDHVRLTNGLAASAAELLPKLRRCRLVEDDKTAQRLAEQYPDYYFLMPDGSCYCGRTLTGGGKTSAGPLALKRELRELTPRIADAQKRLDGAARAAAAAAAEAAARTERLEQVRSELQTLEKGALDAEHELRQTDDRIRRLDAAAAAAAREIERLQEESAQTRGNYEEQAAAAARYADERLKLESRLAELTGRARGQRERLTALGERQAALRAESAALEERRRAAAAALERARRACAEQQQRQEQIARQIERWDEERAQLLADNESLNARIDAGAARRAELRRTVEETAAALKTSRERSTALAGEIKQHREAAETLRQELYDKQMALVQAQADLKHLDETCRADLGKPIEEIARSAPENPSDRDLREAEEQYRGFRQKIERLGAVNVLARKEYEEVEQRRTFLETQHGDLLAAVEDTRQTIREIDAASREKLEEAFRAVNRNFGKMFATLFGGGVGEMRLTDAENPDESGIDIVAQPPGKRLQNIALLSGGEKSLTALALLMATFQYKPSPFCVLDEVDAALDEANNVRFRRLLREMSDRTQFIVVTHSKTTIEIAECLYGVTMSEPGVSGLVSVRTADAAPREPSAGEPGESSAVAAGAAEPPGHRARAWR